MGTLKNRIGAIERAQRARLDAESDWFDLVKELGCEKALQVFEASGRGHEANELRAMMDRARAEVREWERQTFGEPAAHE